MPHPAVTRSLESFEREHVNSVIHIPDYKLRSKLCLEKKEASELVVEAFTVFDVMFYLHIGWGNGGCNYPCMSLSLASAHSLKLAIDLNICSPSFSHTVGENPGQIVISNWATSAHLLEVHKTSSSIPLTVDVPPTHHTDANISLDQTVTLTIVGTLWKLEMQSTDSLWCASYRARKQGCGVDATGIVLGMIDNIASMQAHEADSSGCIQIKLDEEDNATCEAHAFLLQAHSPVFRRMLETPMTEATDRVITMANVGVRELEDLIRCLYQMRIPQEMQEDESRLLALLALTDRYEILAVHSVCASLLSTRLTEANMASVLKIADMHQAPALKKAALQFIACRIERIVAVMDTDDTRLRTVLREHLAASEDPGPVECTVNQDSRLAV